MNTSVNLHVSIIQEITNISSRSGISKSKITLLLINKIKLFSSCKELTGVLTEYQDKISCNKSVAYDKVHFYPDDSIVDFTKMLRFRYRISLSKLVCAAFLFFWEQILEEIFGKNNIPENFFNNYEKTINKFKKLRYYFIERLNYSPIQRE